MTLEKSDSGITYQANTVWNIDKSEKFETNETEFIVMLFLSCV